MGRHKLGTTSNIAKSIDDLEANPKSKGQATVFSERVAEASAAADADIMRAVVKLVEELDKISTSKSPDVHIEATITGGVAGVVGAQNVSIGSMTTEQPASRCKG